MHFGILGQNGTEHALSIDEFSLNKKSYTQTS